MRILHQIDLLLDSSLDFVNEVWDTLEKVQFDKFEGCGISVASAIDATITFLASILQSIQEVTSLLSCSTFNPIYATIVYDGICRHGVSGVTIMFFLQFSTLLRC